MTPDRPVHSPRQQASDPSTVPVRLWELTQLPGDRRNGDSDSGWCRQLVAANPSAPADLLAELSQNSKDSVVRRNVAANPSTSKETLLVLANDSLRTVVDAARAALGVPMCANMAEHLRLLSASIADSSNATRGFEAITPEIQDHLKFLDREHRMSCSDPDDLNRTTSYSESAKIIRELLGRASAVR